MGSTIPVVVGLSGNLRRPSRTRALVEAAGIELARSRRATFRLADLIDAGPGLGAALSRRDLSPEAAELLHAVESADALIIGSPVYKGSYTGLFKHLFDLVEPGALAGKPVLLTATGRVTPSWSSTPCARCSASSPRSRCRCRLRQRRGFSGRAPGRRRHPLVPQ